MTQSQRSRYLKTGAVLAFVLFLLYLLAPDHAPAIGDVVKGSKPYRMTGVGDGLMRSR